MEAEAIVEPWLSSLYGSQPYCLELVSHRARSWSSQARLAGELVFRLNLCLPHSGVRSILGGCWGLNSDPSCLQTEPTPQPHVLFRTSPTTHLLIFFSSIGLRPSAKVAISCFSYSRLSFLLTEWMHTARSIGASLFWRLMPSWDRIKFPGEAEHPHTPGYSLPGVPDS